MRNRQTFIVVAFAAAITAFLFISADSGSDLWTAAWIGFSLSVAVVAWVAWTSIKETTLREMALPITITLLLFATGIGAGTVNMLRNKQSIQNLVTSTALVDESILTGSVRLAMLELFDAHRQSDGTVGFDELMRSGIGTIDSTKIEKFGEVTISESTADRIIFTARSNRAKGNDDTNRLQFIGTVTSGGVQYERQN